MSSLRPSTSLLESNSQSQRMSVHCFQRSLIVTDLFGMSQYSKQSPSSRAFASPQSSRACIWSPSSRTYTRLASAHSLHPQEPALRRRPQGAARGRCFQEPSPGHTPQGPAHGCRPLQTLTSTLTLQIFASAFPLQAPDHPSSWSNYQILSVSKQAT